MSRWAGGMLKARRCAQLLHWGSKVIAVTMAQTANTLKLLFISVSPWIRQIPGCEPV